MYVQGVSTRRVAAITEELCGLELSSGQVSRVATLLDEDLKKFRERPLGQIVYLYLDADYQKVRHEGQRNKRLLYKKPEEPAKTKPKWTQKKSLATCHAASIGRYIGARKKRSF